ncbi:V-type proton ATPase subunit E [Bacillus sp. Marseille-Q3570]|uniref:V-type proton ATPase subunit E n=1 Tax=Bacillus sp. Marseille-Q3570 TaxID=2963522 RepID=UPI0021B7E27B|nr:V-type proton ATPase subunit E [Bacillus sp. Marseille-Q3570]
MFKKWMEQSKRKVVVMVMAGTVIFGTFGGTAYAAYGDNWNTYIKNGISQLYTLVFPEIKKATEDKQNEIISKIKSDIRSNVQSAKGEIEKHKEKLIKENKNELDKYYEDVKKEAEATKNEAVKSGKSNLDEKAKDSLTKAKGEIDRAIEAELKKIGSK